MCSSWGPGKGRARRATLHRQAVDHRMRSATPVCVCVRAVDEAGGGGTRAFGDARRGASSVRWRITTPRPTPRPLWGVGENWPVRGRGPPRTRRGGVGWFFFGVPPLRGSLHTPRRTHTCPSRSALVAPRARWCAAVSGGRALVHHRGRERRGPRRIRSRRATSSSSTTHAVQRPPVGGQAPSFHTVVPHLLVQQHQARHHGGGPASCEAARRTATCEAAPVGAATSGGAPPSRARAPRVCPTQRRNKRFVCEPFRALGRADPRAKASVAPRTPARPTGRTGPARAPRSAAQIPPIQTLYRWAFRASRS